MASPMKEFAIAHLLRMNFANAFLLMQPPLSLVLLWTTQPMSNHPFSLCPIMKANMLDIYIQGDLP